MRRTREAGLAERNALVRSKIDTMVSQPAWLASPKIRRGLLQNSRCTGAATDRVLASCSEKEVVLIFTQVL